MKKIIFFIPALISIQFTRAQSSTQLTAFKSKVNHIIIIYQENWSFDGLYAKFPNANNLLNFDTTAFTQRTIGGDTLRSVPNLFRNYASTSSLPAKPYNLLNYIQPDEETSDLIHHFYTEQLQIDNGKMDKYAAWTDNPGLVMSYFDAYGLNFPEAKLAKQYVLCDNFFHSAFGGSFLNHIFFIAAAPPKWGDVLPPQFISHPDSTSKRNLKDNILTPDGYAVNTVYSLNTPRPKNQNDTSLLLPYQTMPTIGDRLNAAKVSWAWYSGGWDNALAGKAGKNFQYHHQPFIYFKNYENGSANKKIHLKDETDFFASLKNGTLPHVSFIKPYGNYDEHPGYSSVYAGQLHVDSIVRAVMKSKYWNDAVIIIAYDENGGRWDHVAPPKIDRWGPGTRVPAIIISPFAKKDYVDHTQYETLSILKFIETRYGLKPLTARDANANDMLNAFHF